jgi:general secretion pathway protein A
VSIRYELKPLTRDEMAAYIAHRIQVAGGPSAVSFTPKALHAVHQFTGGIPRLINLVCDRALLGAFSARVNRVSHDLVGRAAETLDLRPVERSRFGWLRRGAAARAAGRTEPTSLLYR